MVVPLRGHEDIGITLRPGRLKVGKLRQHRLGQPQGTAVRVLDPPEPSLGGIHLRLDFDNTGVEVDVAPDCVLPAEVKNL
jgi:hypothetical protein